MCEDRHRHREWLKFLRAIDESFRNTTDPNDRGQLRHPQTSQVQRWLNRHPRFRMSFAPIGCSWLNMLERFFRDLTENRLRRGVFRSVEESQAASTTSTIATMLEWAVGICVTRNTSERRKRGCWTL